MKAFFLLLAGGLLATGALTGCAGPDSTAGSDGAAGSDSAVSPAPGAASGSPAALPPERPAPGDHALAFRRSDGTRHDYLLHAPPDYASGKAYPLVLVLHGSPGTAAQARERTGMDAVADANGFLVVYPDQVTETATVAALIDHLIPRWGVDPRRVHATGFSRGATLTYELAQALPDRLASVAPVSGVAPETDLAPLSHPVSLLTFQGGLDRLAQGFAGTNAGWQRAAGCRDERIRSIEMGGGPTHIYTMTCAGGTEHVVYSVTRMGHEWPPEAGELIWEFFRRHPRA